MTCQQFLQLFDTECIVSQLYHKENFKQKGKLQNRKQKKILLGEKEFLKRTHDFFSA